MTAPCPTRVYFPTKRRPTLTAPPADALSMSAFIKAMTAPTLILIDAHLLVAVGDASTATRPSGAGNF